MNWFIIRMTSKEDNIATVTICLYQVSQSKLLVDLTSKGHGDCRYCKADDYNKNCWGYYPIKLYGIITRDYDSNNEKVLVSD